MDNTQTPEEIVTPPASPSDAGSEGRTAQDRINELISKNKELIDKNDQLVGRLESVEKKIDSIPVPTPPPVTETEPNPEFDEAIDILKKKGKLVDQGFLEQKLKTIEDRMVLDGEHRKYEGQIDGSDGRPKYDRFAVEEMMRKEGIYNPLAAYEHMHKTELTDWEIKKYEKERTKKPFVAKPSSTTGATEDKAITREKIAEWIKTPEGRLKYEQHRKEILELMAQGKL